MRIMVSPAHQFLLQRLPFKFPFVFYMYSIRSVSKAGQFQSTYQILVRFYVFLKCLVKGWIVSKYLPDPGLLFVLHLSFPFLIVSPHSINQTLKRSLGIDDLPHKPLLNLIVSIKSSYDSIAQWTKNLPSFFFLIKTYLFSCNLSPLNLFTFGNFHL